MAMYRPRIKPCHFCVSKQEIDYKNIDMLKNFVGEKGKIKNRRKSGLCAKHQRKIAAAVKRVRNIGFIPFVLR